MNTVNTLLINKEIIRTKKKINEELDKEEKAKIINDFVTKETVRFKNGCFGFKPEKKEIDQFMKQIQYVLDDNLSIDSLIPDIDIPEDIPKKEKIKRFIELFKSFFDSTNVVINNQTKS